MRPLINIDPVLEYFRVSILKYGDLIISEKEGLALEVELRNGDGRHVVGIENGDGFFHSSDDPRIVKAVGETKILSFTPELKEMVRQRASLFKEG